MLILDVFFFFIIIFLLHTLYVTLFRNVFLQQATEAYEVLINNGFGAAAGQAAAYKKKAHERFVEATLFRDAESTPAAVTATS